MEIILKQDMPQLGHKDDIVSVKAGYGRNYLIPKGIALLATKNAKVIHAENMRQRAHKEEKIKNQALEVAKKLENKEFKIGAKTSSTGKIFGSVNEIQIAEAINAKGFNIERKNVILKDDSIKEVGKYTATIKLHKEVQFDIEFEVISE